MKVKWTREAIQDRLEVWDYIALDNPQAAAQMDNLFSEAADRLSSHPKMGRKGLVPGTRELIPHPGYRLVYEIGDDTVWIITLIGTARAWPPVKKSD